MSNPANLLYADTHEWVRVENKEAVVGITDFAQHQLGDITYIEIPGVGAILATGQELGVVESVKAASDLFSPVSGKVVAVNEKLTDHPEVINHSPFDEGWLIKVELSEAPAGLMSAAEYEKMAKD